MDIALLDFISYFCANKLLLGKGERKVKKKERKMSSNTDIHRSSTCHPCSLAKDDMKRSVVLI